MEIEVNKQRNFIMVLDTFQGIIREILNVQILNLNEKNNVFFEVYFRNQQNSSLDIFESPQPIFKNNSHKLSLFFSIRFFEQVSTFNDKVILRNILHTYYRDQFAKLANTTHLRKKLKKDPQWYPSEEEYEFTLSDLQVKKSIFN